MLVGIDPFTANDPMEIYQKILNGRIKFPRNFPKDARNLVKCLVTADLTKRYGNLKNGSKDIKDHPWFAGIDWADLYYKKIPAPYLPKVSSASDTRNFESYPESKDKCPAINPSEDPFLKW